MKTCIDDLSIFGGSQTFPEKLHVGRPNIGNRERLLERINTILDRKWFTNNGCFVQELEQRMAELLEVKHCVAVCNATVGLEIVLRALDLQGEVIVPSFTFIASAHAIQWIGLTPVFCDVDRETHNLDPACVEQLITAHTKAILGVHLWGRAANIDALTRIAQKHNLKLIFDAAHAFGCSYKGRKLGNFGNAEVFSFHATKFFTTFEGGIVATNDQNLARRIRLMKNFGFAEEIALLGTNAKMTEVSAAMGITGLESLHDLITVNRQNYLQYEQQLHGIPGVHLIPYSRNEQNNYQYIVLEIDQHKANIRRDQLMEILWTENILARRYFYPGCHRQEPYCSKSLYANLSLPNTEILIENVLVLPTGTAITSEAIEMICQLIRFVIEHGQEITFRLPPRTTYLVPI